MSFRWLGAGALSGFAALGVSAGCSQSPPQAVGDEARVGTTTQAVQGGAADGTAHPFAVGLCIERTSDPAAPCAAFCSGTLILPNLIVTARHCVDDTPQTVDCTTNPQFGARHGGLWITTHDTIIDNANLGWHEVKSVLTTPDTGVCGNDIALLVLKDQVPGTEAKPAIPGVQYPMGDLTRYVRRFTAVGFGNTSLQGFTAGTRRLRASIPVVCIPGDDLAPCPVEVNAHEFAGGDGVCEGDSGSGAFEDRTLAKGAPVSFGVASRIGQSPDGVTCKGSLYTRLDSFRDLVVQAANTASNNWALYPKPVPDWTVYVPPPPDAGAPDASVVKKAPLGDGYACSDNAQCASNVCADTGAGKACTTACDPSVVPTQCQAGYVCTDAVCVQGSGDAPPAATPAATTTTTGCAVAGAERHPPLFGLAALVAAAFAAGRRRRGPRNSR